MTDTMDTGEELTRRAFSGSPPTAIWSTILDSVSSFRSLPSKNVLILGEPGSGKSTIAAALLGKSFISSCVNEKGADKSSNPLNRKNSVDFTLGYDYSDVRDDSGDESDLLARLSVYTVPSSSRAFTSLIPYFLPPRTTLGQTACIVVLDWTKPWTFVEQLEEWFAWIEGWVKGEGATLLQKNKEMERELEMLREENRQRWQAHLQQYIEPSSSSTLPASTSASIPISITPTVLPLGPGTLTHNSAGIPIVVVCTKADLIGQEQAPQRKAAGATGIGCRMVKGKGGEWEDKTDEIMQILRTICLKYGASLFYTTPLPETLSILRQYVLHTLFVPFPPSSLSISLEASQNQSSRRADWQSPPHTMNPFPFLHRHNTLDRDRVVIPSGWDSYGKITVLREFDTKGWSAAWERDIEVREERERKRQNSRVGAQTAVSGDLENPEDSAKRMYASPVPNRGIKNLPSLPQLKSPIPEQAFLAKYYDAGLNADANRADAKAAGAGERGSARYPERALAQYESGGYGAGAESEYGGGIYGAGAGFVESRSTNSFDFPKVHKCIMEMEHSSSANHEGTDRPSSNIGPDISFTEKSIRVSPATHGHPEVSLSSTGLNGGSRPGRADASGTRKEVLQNFFQSLLINKEKRESAASLVSMVGSEMGKEGGMRFTK